MLAAGMDRIWTTLDQRVLRLRLLTACCCAMSRNSRQFRLRQPSRVAARAMTSLFSQKAPLTPREDSLSRRGGDCRLRLVFPGYPFFRRSRRASRRTLSVNVTPRRLGKCGERALPRYSERLVQVALSVGLSGRGSRSKLGVGEEIADNPTGSGKGAIASLATAREIRPAARDPPSAWLSCI